MSMMVQKGLSRRVLVLKCPDKKYFDEAIFILKKDCELQNGQPTELFMLEAEQAARKCLKSAGVSAQKRRKPLAPLFYAGAGAAVTAVGWIVTLFLT